MGEIGNAWCKSRPNADSVYQRNKALIFDARGNGEGNISPTITGDHQNRITDYTAIVIEYEKGIRNRI